MSAAHGFDTADAFGVLLDRIGEAERELGAEREKVARLRAIVREALREYERVPLGLEDAMRRIAKEVGA